MASIILFSILSFSHLLVFFTSASHPQFTAATATTINIPLSPVLKSSQTNDLWETVNHIAKSTLARAHHIKSPKTNSAHPFTAKVPLYARSYGGYSISLRFGTPAQSIPLVMDTGSSLLWVPCTTNYVCSNCTFSNTEPTKIPTFRPKLSSSTKILGCENSKCGWLFGSDPKSRCPSCVPGSKNCSRACPNYAIVYGLGATLGLLLSENLDFPEKVFTDFVVGCSLYSIRQPSGIAGFGRGPSSLPSQLKLSKFSYCLLSHRFDDTPKSSELILSQSSGGGRGDDIGSGVSYTPFRKNPSKSPYNEYYYLTLRKITVGGQHVKIPYKYLVPSPGGSGGTIVDSGSTLTYMEGPVHEPVVREFERQMRRYDRAEDVEAQSGLGPCYNVSAEKIVAFPELELHFKGGAKMELPLANYFSFVGGPDIICMTLVTDSSPGVGSGIGGGPAIIMGNYQQQNYHVEYDLKNQRFGFKKQKCG